LNKEASVSEVLYKRGMALMDI